MKNVRSSQLWNEFFFVQIWKKEEIQVNYTWLLEGIDLLYMVVKMNVLNGIFCKRNMFQPKYYWVKIKDLGAIQNRLMLFLNINRHLLGNWRVSTWIRKAVYLFKIYSNVFVNIQNFQILFLSRKMHNLEISYLQKIKIEI